MSEKPARLHGLYAITDARLIPARHFSRTVALALEGGARVVQYRDKSTDPRHRLRQARALAALCREHDAALIVNDDVELAAAADAHGVHLGRDDTSPARARQRLGPDAIIGLSCYASLERALSGQEQGADYVAFGSFFTSPTKPQAARAHTALLREARRRLSLPLAAIGGINADNGAELVRAGAHMLAVVSGVFGATDVRAAAAAIAGLFANTEASPSKH